MALASASLLSNAASDQFEWLEDVGGKKSLDWVKAQNAISHGMLEKEAGFNPLKNQVLDILNSKERIESHRVSRRLFGLSQTNMACSL